MEKRTLNQINSEIYSIITCQNLRVMMAILAKHFPKCRGQLSKLSNDELEKLIPLLREAYGRPKP